MPVGTLSGRVVEENLISGIGYPATRGCRVTVQYAAFDFRTGKKFSSSWEEGRPLTFTLGRGEVIEGLEQGVEGTGLGGSEEPMEVGERRELAIPPKFAKGGRGLARIPEGSSFILVIDLLRVQLRACV